MNNSLDNLFKSKLEGHSIEPELNAWSRVSSNLSKKNKPVIWFRAAAALMAIGLSFSLWFYSNKSLVSSTKIAQTNNVDPRTSEKSVITPNKQAESKETISTQKIESRKNQTLKHMPTKTVVTQSSKAETLESNELTPATTIVLSEAITEKVVLRIEPLVTSVKKPIVIVYELKPVEMVPKQELEFDTMPERKTGLKKVLEVANDMRTGESTFGGLRQTKDEILAFNFRKEDKNNNK